MEKKYIFIGLFIFIFLVSANIINSNLEEQGSVFNPPYLDPAFDCLDAQWESPFNFKYPEVDNGVLE